MKIQKIATLILMSILTGTALSSETITDHRQAIYLDRQERMVVLEEMRAFLSTLQQITQGVVGNDMNQVSSAARKMGSGASNEVSASLVSKLPLSFKTLAADTHEKFDQIALDASSFAEKDHTLEQVVVLMRNCVVCHEMYRIELEED